MSFRRTAALSAFSLLVLAAVAQAQAPTQTSTQEPAPSRNEDPNSLLAAASAGDAQAQFALGDSYFNARYVTLDYAQALAWYRKSAAQRFAPAQDQLGRMYQHHLGLPQNDKRAVSYYRLAANQGYALAQYHLAFMFEAGRGVKRDYKQAFAWYLKAANQNLSGAEEELAYFYQSGLGVKRDYSQALAWYQRAAGHGNSNAENQLGFMAEEGWGQPQNYVQALSWYNKASDHGNAQAQENIGYMFQHGTGVRTDYAQAMSWFVKAAAQGDGDAANQIGWMFQYGQGVPQDDSRALSWYQVAAGRGNLQGQRNLADLTSDLEESGSLQSATGPVNDAAFLQAQRWDNIQNLRGRIDAVESDALYQEDLASQLEHMDKGKKDGVSKLFTVIGNVGAVKYHVLAAQDRAEAASLRDQLAQLEDPTSPPRPSALPDANRRSRRQLRPGLLRHHVFGVPLRPVCIRRADALLVLAVGGRRTPKRTLQFACGAKRSRASINAPGKPRRDLLQQPAISVGVAEQCTRTVCAPLGIQTAHHALRSDVEKLAHLRAGRDQLLPGGLDVRNDQVSLG